MKKIVIISLFCVVGILFFWSYWQFNSTEKPGSPVTVTENRCAASGEKIGAQGMPEQCCQGLTPIGGHPGGYTGECSVIPAPGGLRICSSCGNNSCETENGENKCNCSQDCK